MHRCSNSLQKNLNMRWPRKAIHASLVKNDRNLAFTLSRYWPNFATQHPILQIIYEMEHCL